MAPKSPFEVVPESTLLKLLSPPTVGTLTAASFAALCPKAGRLPLDRWEFFRPAVPRRVYALLVGFAVGYGATRGIQIVRWKLLKALLTYTGWVYNPKSWKVKGWAILLKLLRGPAPHPTFMFEAVLPKQPLPSLDATLEKWLTVNRVLLNEDEYEMTLQAVEDFRKNEGPRLQKYLEEKAEKTVNWVSDYWLQAAYLSFRDPIAINSNYANTSQFPTSLNMDPLVRIAVSIRLSSEFREMLDRREVRPLLTLDLVPFCMNGITNIFNTVREPGEHMDRLVKYPNSKHVVFIKKGHFFKLDVYAEDSEGKKTMLSCEELRAQIQRICDITDGMEEGPSVAALTSQNRKTWFKQRQQLKLKNAAVLHTVESAMFVACYDQTSPKDDSELCKLALTGRGNDKWFDKSFNHVGFNDASDGNNVEHSVIDAQVYAYYGDYIFYNEGLRCEQFDSTKSVRTLSVPERLIWDIDDMKSEIASAADSYKQVIDDLDVCAMKTKYGKGFMKKCKVSPDGYMQMCLQLAYYRLQKETAKTYEPSTGRLFALGRTETVHPVSQESILWVKSMDDPTVDNATKIQQLKQAIKYQSRFRLEATMGKGCDRHLLGLLCASRELGMDTPNLFRDKAWQMPFKLSTSNVPSRVAELDCTIVHTSLVGVFGPTAHDGYGVCYTFITEETAPVRITSWKSAEKTNSAKFGEALNQAYEDVRKLFSDTA